MASWSARESTRVMRRRRGGSAEARAVPTTSLVLVGVPTHAAPSRRRSPLACAPRGSGSHLWIGEVRAVGPHQSRRGEPLDLLPQRHRPRPAVALLLTFTRAGVRPAAASHEVVDHRPPVALKLRDPIGAHGLVPPRPVARERRGIRPFERRARVVDARGAHTVPAAPRRHWRWIM